MRSLKNKYDESNNNLYYYVRDDLLDYRNVARQIIVMPLSSYFEINLDRMLWLT